MPPTEPWSLRRLWPGVYLPAIVVEIGIGAVVPFLPAIVTAQGGSLAVAGILAAMLPVGHIVADIPAGALAGRIGDRRAMQAACLLVAVAMGGALVAPSLAVLAVCLFLVGCADAVFGLARQSYLTAVVPPLRRARALSTLGGVHRIGLFLGPFVGIAVVAGGPPIRAFGLAVVTSLIAGLIVTLARELPGAAVVRAADGHTGVGAVLREHAGVLARLGIATGAIGLIRGARQVVLPLWGEHLGLDPTTTALVFGISGAVDMLLFYPAGKVMDARGRLWIAIPSMLTMGVALALVPLTTTATGLGVVALLLGLGNGMGSGVVMTLGADVAPPATRAQFLGAWRLLQDTGSAGGPLVLSAGAALGSLAGGIGAVAVLSLGAAAALWRFVPRYSVHANRTTRRRAGLDG
ncbi:MFS transporter [Serinibacter arcticus]|uniref:MFS transporter n=1 Tax=Serinibacter arcticus TaxID=1655435 RepID=A0A2U1ZY36_9MICO|nr:MFS transporter [Serinibacter arcticus]PWD51843.1 MFS transporter [Serinibacter arcticus]